MKKTNNFWLGVLLIGILISVPEGTLIRVVGDTLSVSMMTMLRYAVATVFAVPFIVVALRKGQVSAKRLLYMMLLAIPLALDPLISQYVVATTNASFQAILSLFTPIIFVIISTIVTKDRISRNKILGFLFAVLGGMVMVALPNLGHGSVTNFGSIPVILMLVQALCISVETIVWRRENERGTPLVVILGTFYFVWAIIAGVMALILGETAQIQHLTINNLAIVVYLGIIASITYNAVFTGFYRRIGTTSAATMKYFKKSLTILMPIVVLGETLSWQIALGAFLIIVGTVVAHKKTGSRKKKQIVLS
jgi:drug/metabolite transporter (DMT)-like permease